MYNSGSFQVCMYNKFDGCSNTNNYMGIIITSSTITSTTNTTTTIDSNYIRSKWVVNLSSASLTQAHETLLSRGSNFMVVPWYLHRDEYMPLWKRFVSNYPKEAAELRLEVIKLLKRELSPVLLL